ncbi:MAG: hypothetical protein ABSH06_10060 [Thermodesulfobacteriota bacterium]|jgi:hypothetical protein
MGLDITNAKGSYFRWNILAGRQILSLAMLFGWKSEGSVHADIPWGLVKARDARSLVKALESALASLKSQKAKAKFKTIEAITDPLSKWMELIFSEHKGKGVHQFGPARIIFHGKQWDEAWHKKVLEFIAFCKEGEFTIG